MSVIHNDILGPTNDVEEELKYLAGFEHGLTPSFLLGPKVVTRYFF